MDRRPARRSPNSVPFTQTTGDPGSPGDPPAPRRAPAARHEVDADRTGFDVAGHSEAEDDPFTCTAETDLFS
ncbi:hypothetical protein GCM10023097_20140 [Streptomyces collinus]|uniref:Uncharacterized protein n=1 Tax=Streptomyces collinus TaxID=42684 RepID=A0AA89Q4V0_STRCU|nr:hypothetical protein [Streptomyces collinus]